MEVRLVIVRGAHGRPTFRMRHDELVIGRQKGCGIRVPASSISRQHCRLRQSKGSLFIEDLGSANGTRLNGESVDDEMRVQSGDEITIGPITFRVEYQSTTAARGKQPTPIPQNSDFEMVMEEEPALAEEEATVNNQPVENIDDLLPMVELIEEDSRQAEFLTQLSNDENQPLDLPEGEELRALLSELEDDSPSKAKPKPRPKK